MFVNSFPFISNNYPINSVNPMNQYGLSNNLPSNYLLLSKPSLSNEYCKVWIGRIPPGLSDIFMRKILEACGTVANWNRQSDAIGRKKGFGICEFHSVESMLKALRLLNGRRVEEGYELMVLNF